MKKFAVGKHHILAFVIAGILAVTSPALAEKPSQAGGRDKGGKHEQKEKRDGKGGRNEGASPNQQRDGVSAHVYFGDQHRHVIREYYTEQYRSGQCPPGLARKNNGCMPPGQAKKWQPGQTLPQGIVFHDLPPTVVVQLGLPPAGHRFVRVASDILLIAVGTGMIVDAIQDLNTI